MSGDTFGPLLALHKSGAIICRDAEAYTQLLALDRSMQRALSDTQPQPEQPRYVALHSNGETSSAFGVTPEEAAALYIEEDYWGADSAEPPTTVTVAECLWFKPNDFVKGLGESLCETLDERVYEAGQEWATDISQGLEQPETHTELETVITTWFTKFCQGQGGLNFYTCGTEMEVEVKG